MRTVLIYHQGLPLGWMDVHDDGTVEYEYSGIERLVKNLAAPDGVEADAEDARANRSTLNPPDWGFSIDFRAEHVRTHAKPEARTISHDLALRVGMRRSAQVANQRPPAI